MLAECHGSLKLQRCVHDIAQQLPARVTTLSQLSGIRKALAKLVIDDDWLPAQFAVPGDARYRQYLLYCDPMRRFSMVSFVWLAGQRTPIHNHTVWGAVGQLRGCEVSTAYVFNAAGQLCSGKSTTTVPGTALVFTPGDGDIHRVVNPGPDTAISIHVYGADIGAVRRSTFDANTGEQSSFVSGYDRPAAPETS